MTDGVNDFTGGLTLNAGTLQFAAAGASGTGTIFLDGGTIEAFGSGITLDEAIEAGGNFTVGGSQNLELTDGDGSQIEQSFTLTVISDAVSLSVALVDGSVTIRWLGGGGLQMADSVGGPYFDVPNATSYYEIDPVGMKFFRVVN